MNRILTAGAAALIGAGSIVTAVAPTTVLAQGRGGMGGGHASMGGGHASMGGSMGGRVANSGRTGFRDRDGRFGFRDRDDFGRFGFRDRDDFRFRRFGFRGCCFGPGPFFAGVAVGAAWGYPYGGCRVWNPHYGRYVVRYGCYY
jgi:hypothetical protein